MKSNSISCLLLASGATLLNIGSAHAAEILVTNNIATSTTWVSTNTYNQIGQVYVQPGVTLTIQPGTVIASEVGGSLAVTRGARINAVGTNASPIIFTSKADVATWTNGDPRTGTWRPECNEWGNLTIMGRSYISENAVAANTPSPNANNIATMEGLTAAA